MEDTEKVKHPKDRFFYNTLIIMGLIIFGVAIFAAGLFVGFEKARFSQKLGEKYYSDFIAGPKLGPGGVFQPGYVNAHGASGIINNINGNELTVSDHGINKTILLSDTTTINKGGTDIKTADLKIGDSLIIIGSPNQQGQIQAKFIQVK